MIAEGDARKNGFEQNNMASTTMCLIYVLATRKLIVQRRALPSPHANDYPTTLVIFTKTIRPTNGQKKCVKYSRPDSEFDQTKYEAANGTLQS